jgi:hypothetical protein
VRSTQVLVRSAQVLALRGLGADRRWAAGLVVAVAVSTAVVATFPPLYADAQDDALQAEAAAATARERDLEVVQAARLRQEDPEEIAAERLGAVPAELARLVDGSTVVIDTPMYRASSHSGSPNPRGTARFLTLRAHAGVGEHVRVVAGELPKDGSRLEVALSAATARALSVRVGDELDLAPDRDQPQLQSVPLHERFNTIVRVAAIVEAPAEDPYWFGDERSLRPRVEETETQRLVFGSALLPGSAHSLLLSETGGMPLTYRWRYRVDSERLDVGALDRLEDAARALELRYGVVAESGSPEAEARTGIGRIFERFREQQRVAAASLSFAGAGFLGLALVVVIAAALAGGAAQRAALSLARDRGGSVTAVAAATALALVVPAALAGLLAAIAVTRPDAAGAMLALALAAVAALAITVVVAPRARVPQDALAARQAREQRDRRRAAIESTLVTVALAGTVALRTRDEAPEGFDVLAAATPVLVVLAGVALALRLLSPIARLVAARLRRRADLAPTLAARRVERQGALGVPPLVVPFVAAAIATFGSLTTGGASDAATPLLETVGDALAAISYLGLAYAGAAIVVVVAVIMRERSDDDRRLASLGLRRGQALALALAQFVPVILAGALAGALVAGLAYVTVRPAFDPDAVALGVPLAPLVAVVALPLVGALAVVLTFRRRPV